MMTKQVFTKTCIDACISHYNSISVYKFINMHNLNIDGFTIIVDELYDNIMSIDNNKLALVSISSGWDHRYMYKLISNTRPESEIFTMDLNPKVYSNDYHRPMLLIIIIDILMEMGYIIKFTHTVCGDRPSSRLSLQQCTIITIVKNYNIIPKKIIEHIDIHNGLGEMYLSCNMFDCTLICIDDTHIHVHALVLGIISDVFNICLSGKFTEANTKEIRVDFAADVVQFVINYIYLQTEFSDIEDYTSEFIMDVFRFAHMYNIRAMVDIAANMISETVTDYVYVKHLVDTYNNDHLRVYLDNM